MPGVDATGVINFMGHYADAVVAHNAEFDKQWMTGIGLDKLDKMKWICSCVDFTWPNMKMGAKKLTDIAIFRGIPVIGAHRALADCLLLVDCFNSLSDLPARLAEAAIGKNLYRADVSFSDKDLAKEAGFNWDRLIPRAWSVKLSEAEAAAITTFKITKMD
jgi:DNA polymerase-3 subunit epsilon